MTTVRNALLLVGVLILRLIGHRTHSTGKAR
jgi:hypothetical protein